MADVDSAFIRRAVELADLNAVRVTLFMHTHDPLKAWKASNGSHDLYIEITKYLVEKNKVATLKEFAKECPTALANHEHISLAKALVALDENKFEEARKHLVREYIYVREGNFITTNIWFNSFFKPEEIKLGRSLTDAEKEKIKTKNPPPAIIDFQMKE